MEYQYKQSNIDIGLLERKIEKELSSLIVESFDKKKFADELAKMSDTCFDETIRISLMEEILCDMGLAFDKEKVIVHNNCEVGVGVIIPFLIPNEIHVLFKLPSNFNGFAVFMHEIGHAMYYSHINDTLPFDLRHPYNVMLDEGIALFFQNVLFTKEWLFKYMQYDYELLDAYYNRTLLEQICFTLFEKELYVAESNSYDEIWQVYKNKYNPFASPSSDWSTSHFYISAPAYTAGHLSGEFFAKNLITYFLNKNNGILNRATGNFLVNSIFIHGKKCDLNNLLRTVLFI